MRSPREYIVTKEEVHGYANFWLESALKLEYQGRKCTGQTVLQVLLIAAARVVSIFAACRDLAQAPSDQTIRNALGESLPEMAELERRLNRALVADIPKALRRRARMLAIDLTLLPYHGQPWRDKREIYRGQSKAGTTHFHAYATAVVVHKGYRYTLALTHVEHKEKMKDVVQRLVRIVRRRSVKIKFLLLDKGFFSVEMLLYLKRAKYGYILPAAIRGRTPKRGQPATGLRALRRKKHGYYAHTLTGKVGGQRRSVQTTICVAGKSYQHKKSGKPRRKKLLYAIWKVHRTPRAIRELYRKRFGVETSYRQLNEARSRTCTRDPPVVGRRDGARARQCPRCSRACRRCRTGTDACLVSRALPRRDGRLSGRHRGAHTVPRCPAGARPPSCGTAHAPCGPAPTAR